MTNWWPHSQPDVITDRVAQSFVSFPCHTLSYANGTDTSRLKAENHIKKVQLEKIYNYSYLSDQNIAASTLQSLNVIVEYELRHLRRFPTTRSTSDYDGAVFAQSIKNIAPKMENRLLIKKNKFSKLAFS